MQSKTTVHLVHCSCSFGAFRTCDLVMLVAEKLPFNLMLYISQTAMDLTFKALDIMPLHFDTECIKIPNSNNSKGNQI